MRAYDALSLATCKKLAVQIMATATKGFRFKDQSLLYEMVIKISSIFIDNYEALKDGMEPGLQEELSRLIKNDISSELFGTSYFFWNPESLYEKIRDRVEHRIYYPNVGVRPKAKL